MLHNSAEDTHPLSPQGQRQRSPYAGAGASSSNYIDLATSSGREFGSDSDSDAESLDMRSDAGVSNGPESPMSLRTPRGPEVTVTAHQVATYIHRELSRRKPEPSPTGLYFHLALEQPCLWHGSLDAHQSTSGTRPVQTNTNSDEVEVFFVDMRCTSSSSSTGEAAEWGYRSVSRSALVALEDVHVDLLVLRAYEASRITSSSINSHSDNSDNSGYNRKKGKSTAAAAVPNKVYMPVSQKLHRAITGAVDSPGSISGNSGGHVHLVMHPSPLPPEVVRIVALLYAILDFVFWDDIMQAQLCSHYLPPPFVIDLLLNPGLCREWIERADVRVGEENGLHKYAVVYAESKAQRTRSADYCSGSLAHLASVAAAQADVFRCRQLYTLLMCAQQSGLEEDYKLSVSPAEIPTLAASETHASSSGLHCSQEFMSLLSQMRKHYADVLVDTDEERDSDSDYDSDTGDTGGDYLNRQGFSRGCSRVGSCYQVDLGLLPAVAPCVKQPGRSAPTPSLVVPSVGAPLAYAPTGALPSSASYVRVKPGATFMESSLPDDSSSSSVKRPLPRITRLDAGDVAGYLAQVRQLRWVMPGQIVDAPRSPCVGLAFNPSTKSAGIPGGGNPVLSSSSSSGAAIALSPARGRRPPVMASPSPGPVRRVAEERSLVTCLVLDKFSVSTLPVGTLLSSPVSPTPTAASAVKSSTEWADGNTNLRLLAAPCVGNVLGFPPRQLNIKGAGSPIDGDNNNGNEGSFIDDRPPRSPSGLCAPTCATSSESSNLKTFVTVTDGLERWTTSLSSCRLTQVPEDVALEILCTNGYDIALSLSHIAEILGVSPSDPSEGLTAAERHGLPSPFRPIQELWTLKQFKILKSNAERFREDPWGLFQYMRKCIVKAAVIAGAGAGAGAGVGVGLCAGAINSDPISSAAEVGDVVRMVAQARGDAAADDIEPSALISRRLYLDRLTLYVPGGRRRRHLFPRLSISGNLALKGTCGDQFEGFLDVFMRCFQAYADFRHVSRLDGRYGASLFGRRGTAENANSSGNGSTTVKPIRSVNNRKSGAGTAVGSNSSSSSAGGGGAAADSALWLYRKTESFNAALFGVRPSEYMHQPSCMWPYAVLSMAAHSVYWLKRNNCPCLCLGVDVAAYRSGAVSAYNSSGGGGAAGAGSFVSAPYLRIVPIDVTTPRRMTLVSPSALESFRCQPLDVAGLLRRLFGNTGNDASVGAVAGRAGGGGGADASRNSDSAGKSLEFANALVDFTVYKLRRLREREGGNPSFGFGSLCRWFLYPEFVRMFMDDTQGWALWRRQAERRVVVPTVGDTPNINHKLSSRELYVLGLLDADMEEHLLQRLTILDHARSVGVTSSSAGGRGQQAFLRSFEWGEGLYILRDFPWEDDAFLFDCLEDEEEEEEESGGGSEADIDVNPQVGVDKHVVKGRKGARKRQRADSATSGTAVTDADVGTDADADAVVDTDADVDVKDVDAGSSGPSGKKPRGQPKLPPVTGDTTTGAAAVPKKTRKRSRQTEPASAPVPPPPPVPVIPTPSPLNIYWLGKAQLPCLFYDDLERERGDRFNVLPVNCVTYQYYTQVTRQQVEPLTLTNLRRCTDEKTREFAAALIRFAQWDLEANPQKLGEDVEYGTAPPLYQWPDFILDLMTRPREWGVWRKEVVRRHQQRGGTGLGSGGALALIYFEALRAEFEEICASEDASVASPSSASLAVSPSLSSAVSPPTAAVTAVMEGETTGIQPLDFEMAPGIEFVDL